MCQSKPFLLQLLLAWYVVLKKANNQPTNQTTTKQTPNPGVWEKQEQKAGALPPDYKEDKKEETTGNLQLLGTIWGLQFLGRGVRLGELSTTMLCRKRRPQARKQ